MLPASVARQTQSHAPSRTCGTTFGFRDAALEEALFAYLTDPVTGLFRGPFLDLRLPFRQSDGAEVPLDIAPPFAPYAHQLRAFERLSSRPDRSPPLPPLVTTGTGSGKTECFLYPHPRPLLSPQRANGGIKALLLYPMNALAMDQARRIASELASDPRLEGVSAGLYVGGEGQHAIATKQDLVDQREVLRRSPPDILLTNYRMLDLLLMRPADNPLWRHNRPARAALPRARRAAHLRRRPGLGRRLPHPAAQGPARNPEGAPDLRRDLRHHRFGWHPRASRAARLVRLRRPSARRSDWMRSSPRLDSRPARLSPEESAFFDDPFEVAASNPEALDPSAYANPQAYLDAQANLWLSLDARDPVALGDALGRHQFLRELFAALEGKDRTQRPARLAPGR